MTDFNELRRDNIEYIKKQNAETIASDKKLAGDVWPSCPCFQTQMGIDMRHQLIQPMADDIVEELVGVGTCPLAMPYFMAQLFSIVISKAAAYESEGAPRPDDETFLRNHEDVIAAWTAQIAFLLPKLVGNHTVIARQMANTLGVMAVAATRTDAS